MLGGCGYGFVLKKKGPEAKRLEADNVDVAVVHVPTIKPLDREAILRTAKTARLIVTLENHIVVGGLAESVASCLAFAGQGRRVVPIALPDGFLDAGALPTLHDRYGLSTDEVVAKVKAEFGDNTDAPTEPRDTGEEDPPGPAKRDLRAPDGRPLFAIRSTARRFSGSYPRGYKDRDTCSIAAAAPTWAHKPGCELPRRGERRSRIKKLHLAA